MQSLRRYRNGCGVACVLLLAVAALTGCQTTQTTHAGSPDGPPPPLPIQKVHDEPALADVLFELDSAAVPEDAVATMRGVLHWLKKYPADSVTVVGHGCDLGNRRYNHALGMKRAETIRAVLVEQCVPESRITVVSRGETAPVVPNDSEHRARNRRVSFELQRHH